MGIDRETATTTKRMRAAKAVQNQLFYWESFLRRPLLQHFDPESFVFSSATRYRYQFSTFFLISWGHKCHNFSTFLRPPPPLSCCWLIETTSKASHKWGPGDFFLKTWFTELAIKHSEEEKNVLNYFHFINATDLTIIFGLEGALGLKSFHVGLLKKSQEDLHVYLYPKSFGWCAEKKWRKSVMSTIHTVALSLEKSLDTMLHSSSKSRILA